MTAPEKQTGPHDGQPVLFAGVPLESATAGAILVHGRGADARDILGLVPALDPGGVAYAAPEAAAHTWYPYSFLAPIAENEPGISSGLRVLQGLVQQFAVAGIAPERVALIGFSQGACLVLEYAARHARHYGAVAAFSGGLIGPPGTPRDYAGSLHGTPVFIGCGDMDAHIPQERVLESEAVFMRMGAAVTRRLYPGMGHGINDDELAFVRALLAPLPGWREPRGT